MITIKYNSKILSDKIIIADNFATRLMGFMFKKIPESYDGILFYPGKSIHTCFMRFSLDVVFISNKGEVIKIIRNLAPWRQTWIYFKAHKVLELPAGKLPSDIKEGQFLEVPHV